MLMWEDGKSGDAQGGLSNNNNNKNNNNNINPA